MDKQKILELASKIILASVTQSDIEIESISEELKTALKLKGKDEPPRYKESFLKFTEKEISLMDKDFKKTFRAQGCTAHVRRRYINGHRYYEIRYRKDGYNISVTRKTVDEAKARFIEVVKNYDRSDAAPNIPRTFNEFAMYYFETFRKRKVAERTYKEDLWRYKKYLYPVFKSTPIKNITPAQCQKLIDEIVDSGKFKTSEEIFSLLNVILKMAVKHDLIRRNPLDIIFHTSYERQHGKALTKDEEIKLLQASAHSPYQTMFAVALFTGLRPNELQSATIQGKFIVAVNSKQKDGKVHYKKIPITPKLKPYLKNVSELKFYKPEQLRKRMNEILPGHKLYDLRTTFYTRCQECGVSDIARKLFVGHTLGKLENTYTDVSDDYLITEGNKLNY